MTSMTTTALYHHLSIMRAAHLASIKLQAWAARPDPIGAVWQHVRQADGTYTHHQIRSKEGTQ